MQFKFPCFNFFCKFAYYLAKTYSGGDGRTRKVRFVDKVLAVKGYAEESFVALY